MVNRKKIKERIEKLKKEINHHRYLYHVLDKQEISDNALDSLKHELFQLEQKCPEFITSDSPTQRIGGKPLKEFKKNRHLVTQWSFNDAFNEDEIRDFDVRVKKELSVSKVDYIVEPKIDGMHIILTYKKGILEAGATRGDGKIGEDVTQNLRTIEGIPLRLRNNVDIVVEGEVYMRKSVFQKINNERKKRKEALFSNPRNTAAGAIRQLNPKIVAERKLDVFIYDYSWPEKDIPKTQLEELQKLIELGFKVNKHFQYCVDIDKAIEYWKKWEKKREKEDYWIDGVVVKVNRRDYQNDLGYTGKAPRWAIAFKWPGEQAVTVLQNVLFQIGRTGKITPVAVLKPVKIGGTTVTRATLHNADEIKRLGIRIGDTIIVEKAGDVIPHIIKVLPGLRSKNTKEVKMLEKCPICGSSIVRTKEEVAHYCSNKNCGARQKNKLHYFASKKAFDIDGLGPNVINQLMDEGLVSQAHDFFLLKKGDLQPLERFAEKSSANLVSAIQASKKITLQKLICAFSIKYVGEETAELLKGKIKNITDLIKFFSQIPQEDLETIKGIGPKAAKSIKNWFSRKENITFLKKLQKTGIKIEALKKKIISKKLIEKTFLFTGELKSMSRVAAREAVKSRGGKIVSSVSGKTDFVIAGEKPGSKFEKAKELGIKIINEKEFLKILKV